MLFGLIYGLAKGFDLEAIIVSITGLFGFLIGSKPFETRMARVYDLVVGLLFAGVGLLGILSSFPLASQMGIHLSTGEILGLKLAIPFSLIHTVLGLTSLNHGFKPTPVTTPVTVAPPPAAA